MGIQVKLLISTKNYKNKYNIIYSIIHKIINCKLPYDFKKKKKLGYMEKNKGTKHILIILMASVILRISEKVAFLLISKYY